MPGQFFDSNIFRTMFLKVGLSLDNGIVVRIFFLFYPKLDIENPIIRINTAFKDYSSTKKHLFYHEFTMIEYEL